MKRFVAGLVVGVVATAGLTWAIGNPNEWGGAQTFPGRQIGKLATADYPGLTKREYAAIHAMQGLLAGGNFKHSSNLPNDTERATIASTAWVMAGAMEGDPRR